MRVAVMLYLGVKLQGDFTKKVFEFAKSKENSDCVG